MLGQSTSPTSTIVDWSDTFYQYVKARILEINPVRLFSGIVSASDWPPQEMIPESYYLITSTLDPNRGQGVGTNSWTAPIYGEQVQWAWSIIGTDIAPNALATNRGDRYRTYFKMIQEILQGMYPGSCLLKQWIGNEDGTVTGTPYFPQESIMFTKPKFSERMERTTGILFGSASVVITGISPTINS
jgi:hypothetical protein